MEIIAYGIQTPRHKREHPNNTELPCQKQITVCKEWLLQATKRKTFNTNHSSYGLKHIVECAMGTYISNGAFIQAAVDLGYSIKPTDFGSPNAYFNMSIKKCKRSTNEF